MSVTKWKPLFSVLQMKLLFAMPAIAPFTTPTSSQPNTLVSLSSSPPPKTFLSVISAKYTHSLNFLHLQKPNFVFFFLKKMASFNRRSVRIYSAKRTGPCSAGNVTFQSTEPTSILRSITGFFSPG